MQVIVQSQGEITKLMTNFFHDSFRQIAQTDFDLMQLTTMKSVMDEESERIFEKIIPRLKLLERVLKQEIPTVLAIRDFIELLRFLREHLNKRDREQRQR